ncbi:hypothetical protein HXX76_014408 [Chlamydomonas incerta]|uniref:Uncharacterized protein n=1 Tax=Chlamydomonas incerta TaxID=51695 RepID=A0A835VPL9_CHLIN|nr:hypothetical protein HXX76_014408 [Chlamydomonas incerta]|eukprot:KAG2424527.1 hypothetical protein HXX76_014408 [Chlamydomonas incerta]
MGYTSPASSSFRVSSGSSAGVNVNGLGLPQPVTDVPLGYLGQLRLAQAVPYTSASGPPLSQSDQISGYKEGLDAAHELRQSALAPATITRQDKAMGELWGWLNRYRPGVTPANCTDEELAAYQRGAGAVQQPAAAQQPRRRLFQGNAPQLTTNDVELLSGGNSSELADSSASE